MSLPTTYTKTYSTEIPDFYIRISIENDVYTESCFIEKTNEIRPYIEDCPIVKKIRKIISQRLSPKISVDDL